MNNTTEQSNILAGAEVHEGDKGYSVGTQEECEAFANRRNFEILAPDRKKIYERNVATKSKFEEGKNG